MENIEHSAPVMGDILQTLALQGRVVRKSIFTFGYQEVYKISGVPGLFTFSELKAYAYSNQEN